MDSHDLDPAGLDPEVRAGLAGLPPDLDAARGLEAFSPAPDDRVLPPPGGPGLAVEDVQVARFDGRTVPTRVYRPLRRTAAAGRGVLVLHGGGFISGSPALADPTLQGLARELDAVVLAPTYRLAPAEPYPAALDDVRAVLAWMAQDAASLGVDPHRLVAFGVSSGGALAAALALLGRDGAVPPLARLVLGFPALDDRLATTSSRHVTDHRVWNHGMARLSWSAYLSGLTPGSAVPATAAPARAGELSGLPATTITLNQHDPLRDEGLAWAKRLWEAGVACEAHLLPGTFHGSMGFVPDAIVSRREQTILRQAIARA